MNLTRVGMRAGDFPYGDFTNGKDRRTTTTTTTTTTRTDENAHYYYFTGSLPHMNLTRVGMGVHEAPLDWEQQTRAQPNADASRQCNFGVW
jgi:hypothetical protein